LIGAGEFARAVPFARKAVQETQVGSLTRGYATFNLGYALLKVGRCAASLPYLRKALAIEAPAQAPFIRPRIKQAKRCVQRGASGPAPSRS
jgi:Tfp pilus assembly protein PilF